MGNKNVDLSKLKEEIHTRKQAKGDVVDGQTVIPKDKFLNGLIESLNTGRETDSTQLIKLVENKTSEKTGGKPISSGDNTMVAELEKRSGQVNPQSNVEQKHNIGGSEAEREAKLYEEFERKKKELMGGGLTNINHDSGHSSPPPSQNSQIISEAKLYETVNNVISEKFAIVVEQAMKDSIVEIYSAARMKEVIEENKDLIRNIVVEVIRGLQTKKKPQ